MNSSVYNSVDDFIDIQWINNNVDDLDLSNFYATDNSFIKEKYIQLIIEDEGSGFNEKNINKVFNLSLIHI